MALRQYDFENTPTVSVVKKMLTDAIRMEATDIHLDPTEEELVIRFRISGELKEYTVAPDNVKVNIITRIKILAGMNITDSLLPQTGAINFELDNKGHNMQVSSLPVMDGEKIVVHISNYAKNIKNLDTIGFTEANTKKIKNLLSEPQGMVLITGNTNSGKSTTMYSILKELNSKENNIISVEEPVKMRIKGINQVQIAPEKGLTYRNVLKSVMLQDPNIVAIQDLVDDETTRAALRTSVTGRLVISTMHTKTAYQTIDTLLNMDVENYLLGSNLIGIISQRLVKKLCPSCRKARAATPYEASVIKEVLGSDVSQVYEAQGCIECHDGFIDQMPIAEVVEIDEELRNAISNNKSRALIRSLVSRNSDSVIKDGLRKVIDGMTTFDEVIKVMDLRVDFTEDDKKIREIILGNGTPTEEFKEEVQSTPEVKQETTPLSPVQEAKEEEIKVEEKETQEAPFVKVEDTTNENVTSLPVSENELNTMLDKIEKNANTPFELNNNTSNIEEQSTPTTPEESKEVQENAEVANDTQPTPVTTEVESNPGIQVEEGTNVVTPVSEEVVSTPEETKEEATPVQVEEPSNEAVTQEVTVTEQSVIQENPALAEQTVVPTPMEATVVPDNTVEQAMVVDNANLAEAPAPVKEEVQSSTVIVNSVAEPVMGATPTPLETPSVEPVMGQPVIEQTVTPVTESVPTTPTAQPINFEDDDDDDNFNYGDSYINNF